MTDRWVKYARAASGKRSREGRAMRLAATRFLRDIKDRRWEFRADKVRRCISFISILRHFKGSASGKSFTLEPWQEFIVANIVGFYHRGTTDRRFTSSYIEVSRKNGKTALAAALCIYFLIADGEDGAEVDLAANSKEQAKIAYEFCEQFARQLDPQSRDLKVYRDRIAMRATASMLRVFAADDSKLDGFNASFALLDEFHAAKNGRLRDVLKSSMGMRQNPHLCTITTAGFDKTGPCYKLRSTAMDVLHGLKEDDSLFAAIYSMEDDDDWQCERNWRKCTPNLDVTVTTKYLREQVRSAVNNPAEEVGVRTKNLNQWCDAEEVWIPADYIRACSARVAPADFEGSLCWAGVDLAAVSDITAVTYLFLRDDDPMYYFHTDYYLPESCLRESPNRDLYRCWRQQGLLTLTPGNVTDYDYITNDMLRVAETSALHRVGYDKWNSTQWAISATDKGLPLCEYSQTIGHFNQPTREFQRLILSGQAVIDDNEITRWMFANVALKSDHNGNVKPNKGLGSERKIDGIISQIQALGIYLESPRHEGGATIFTI